MTHANWINAEKTEMFSNNTCTENSNRDPFQLLDAGI